MTAISAKRREKAATVRVDGKAKYPIDSQKTAESALRLIHNAKPKLTESQEATVRAKAARFGAKPKQIAAKKRGATK